jgi:hypothetical protein
VPPPLPQVASRQRDAKFSTALRSQPPARKRRRSSIPPRSEIPPLSRGDCDPDQFSARCVAFEPRMSELAVSNDVLRESLRVAAPPSLSSRLEQRMSAWLPTFEHWLIGALYWFSERAAWQRGALSMGIGALIGLSVVFAGAGIFGSGRREPAASAPPSRALVVAPVAALRQIAPAPAPSVPPVAAPAIAAAPEAAATELLLQEPESKPASKPAKKRSRLHRRAASKNSTWTLPRPQRRSP